MNKIRIAVFIFVSLFAINIFAQDFEKKDSSLDDTREILEMSENLNDDDIETILELTKEIKMVESNRLDQGLESLQSAYASTNSSWQVIRITHVASPDYLNGAVWDEISQYDSITPGDHGGNWLYVITEEFAYNPIYLDANAKFRYWNATEIDSADISNGFYQGTQRLWLVQNSFTTGDFDFDVSYFYYTGVGYQLVDLHRELEIR